MPVLALPPSSRSVLDRVDDLDPFDDGPATRLVVETVRLDAVSALVRVAGELDLATTPPLWAVLEGHVAAGRRFLRLDLAGVRFVDATALSGILSVHHRLLARRGTLVVTGVRPPVERVLYLSGLDDVLLVGGPRADDDTDDRFDVSAGFPAFHPVELVDRGGPAPGVAFG